MHSESVNARTAVRFQLSGRRAECADDATVADSGPRQSDRPDQSQLTQRTNGVSGSCGAASTNGQYQQLQGILPRTISARDWKAGYT